MFESGVIKSVIATNQTITPRSEWVLDRLKTVGVFVLVIVLCMWDLPYLDIIQCQRFSRPRLLLLLAVRYPMPSTSRYHQRLPCLVYLLLRPLLSA